MQNNTKNIPLIPPINQGISPDNTAGLEEFRSEISKAGISLPNEIIADERIHRFSSNGKTSDNAGWYVLFTDRIPAGAFGCWREDFKINWCSKDKATLTQSERSEFNKKMAEAKKLREHEEEINRTKARNKASKIWEQSTEAPTDHPYLLSKKVQPHGLKLSRDKLVVPLYDQNQVLQSLQFIGYDGDKRFLSGGLTKGCYYPIGGTPDKILYVAEGFATAATVHEATGSAVAVAFNANNLESIAKALRAKFPNLEMVICADDDHKTKGNPGIRKAIEAATASRSKVVIPEFGGNRSDSDTDLNDLFVLDGPKSVICCLDKIYEPDKLQSKLISMKLKNTIEKVKNGDFGAHVENEVIPYWRLLKQTDRAEFERLWAELKDIRGVNIRVLDNIIREGNEGEEANRQVAERLVELVNEKAEIFHDESDICYATFKKDGHRECWSLDSSGFREWLSYNYFMDARIAPSETSQKAALNTLFGQAKFEGPEKSVFRRVARFEDAIWIDMCDEEWRAVKVTAGGWEILDNPSVMFVRSPTMRPLPNPSEKGDLAPLWSLLNIPKGDQSLVLCWILECYRIETPYVVLELVGEQGSAKSKTQDVLRDFIDPNQVNLRAKPKNRESLFISAENSHLISYENLSHLQPEMQDAFCTLATGGGFADRMLYTNKEESIIDVKRPVILNGISVLVTAQDLLDRTIHIDMPRIVNRKTEKQIEKEISENKGTIWAGLLDLLADALKILPSVQIGPDVRPRMADFAYLGESVYRSLGKDEGNFLADYEANRYEGVHRTIDSSPVASKLIDFIDCSENQEFKGTIGALFDELNDMSRHEDAWPKSARGFGSSLRRMAPSLRTLGYKVQIDEKRSNDGYRCLIRKVSRLQEFSASDTNENDKNESDEAHSEGYQTLETDYEEF